MLQRLRRLRDEWRPSAVTMGRPAMPLAVLFGLNAVDELDRTAFSVLLPDIGREFGLGDSTLLTLVALSTIAVLVLELPLSFYCDRANRVRIATVGAAVWAFFSVGTGLAVSVVLLGLARVGAGAGRAVVTPTHSSLLSDFYEPRARVKVFSVHRLANSVGQIAGPLVAGVTAWLLGWRAPFLLFAIPTLVFVVLSMRLRDPGRGEHERRAAGADEALATRQDVPEGVWATMRVLASIPTIRRVWAAVPFLGIALVAFPSLLSLVYEDVFDLGAAQRGVILAAVEPLQIAGVLVALPFVSRVAHTRPAFLLRFVAIVGVVDGVLLVGLANAPNVATAIAIHAVIAGSIGTLAPAFYAMLSLLAPPRVRSAAFSTMSIFAVPGIAVFLPLIGTISDTYGIRASMLTLVPISVAAGVVLSTAGRTIADDIEAVRVESVARVAADAQAELGSLGDDPRPLP